MRHYNSRRIRLSKYFRTFRYGKDRFFYHSCLGNPVKVNAGWRSFVSLLEGGVTLLELSKQPTLIGHVKLLLEKQILEYEGTPDLIEVALRDNERMLPTGEMIDLLVLDLHTACNMGCSYCYASKTQKKHGLRGAAMSFSTAKAAIDGFVALKEANKQVRGAISYFGGEPLLNHGVLSAAMAYVSEFNRSSRHLQLSQAITTNGFLIKEGHVTEFKENNCFVALSMDGLRAEHDQFRILKNGTGTFDRVERSLHLLIEGGVSLEVIVTVGTHNAASLTEFVDYLASSGVRRISIKGQTYKELNDDDRHHISVGVMRALEHASERGMVASKGPGALDFKRGCQGLGGLVCVEASGDVYPCPEGSRIKLGSVSDFSAIASSPGYRRISSRITGNMEQCQGCDVEGLCRGGCAGESEYRFDDVYKIDPTECDSIRASIKRNLALFGKN